MAQKPAQSDWSKVKIKYELHRRGLTFKGLAIAHGYRSVDAISQALHRPYPKAERIYAEAVETTPEAVWPSRYRVNHMTKSSASEAARNVRGPGRLTCPSVCLSTCLPTPPSALAVWAAPSRSPRRWHAL